MLKVLQKNESMCVYKSMEEEWVNAAVGLFYGHFIRRNEHQGTCYGGKDDEVAVKIWNLQTT